MLTTREAIAIKIQTGVGVEATIDPAADAILVSELSFANEGLRMVERNNIKPTISTDQKIFAGTLKKISFTAELKGSGTAGTPPEMGQALRCCGLDETVTPGTSVVYQPVSEGHEYATVYYYQDGILNKLVDAKGTCTFSAETGAIGKVQFEITGKDAGAADTSFPALSYNSTIPSPFINVPFSVDSFDAVINTITLAAGNTVAMPGNVRDEYGFGDIRITKRDPNGTIDPEATLLATKDFQSIFKSGTRMAMTTGAVGATAGNQWKLDATIAIRDIAPGEREQIRTNELTYGCHETSGDDEWSATFS